MSFSRRDALRTGLAGRGVWPAFAGRSAAQSGFPPIPSRNAELRQLVPVVYAYTQATGPGVNDSSLSNAGTDMRAQNEATAEYLKLRGRS